MYHKWGIVCILSRWFVSYVCTYETIHKIMHIKEYKQRLYDHFLTVAIEGDKRQVRTDRRILIALLTALSDLQMRSAGLQHTYCTNASIAKVVAVSRATVYRSLERLESQGLIKKEYRIWRLEIPQELADQINLT